MCTGEDGHEAAETGGEGLSEGKQGGSKGTAQAGERQAKEQQQDSLHGPIWQQTSAHEEASFSPKLSRGELEGVDVAVTSHRIMSSVLMYGRESSPWHSAGCKVL